MKGRVPPEALAKSNWQTAYELGPDTMAELMERFKRDIEVLDNTRRHQIAAEMGIEYTKARRTLSAA